MLRGCREVPACSLRGLWGSEEEAFPFSERLVKVHGDRSCSSRGPVSRAPPPPLWCRFFLETRRAALGRAVGWENILGHFGGRAFQHGPCSCAGAGHME